jgi:hypothetical protein
MPYTRQTWQPGRAGGTPLSVARVTHIEDGIFDAAATADTAATSASLAIASVNALASRVTTNEAALTGVATQSYVDAKTGGLATTSYVDTKTAGMATQSYVDTQVSTRATPADVTAAIAPLTTKTYVDTQVANVSAVAGVLPGVVMLDTFGGTTDDDRLTAALSYAAAQTQKPAIMFPNRFVSLTQTRQVYGGMKLIGPPVVGWQNPEISSNSLNPTRVRLNCGTGSSSWLVGPSNGDTFDVAIRDLSFESTNANTQFLHYPVSVGTLYCANFHNLGFQAFRNVLGNETTAVAFTLCSTTGDWNMNTARGTQVNIAGSDNLNLWRAGSINIGPGGNGTNLGGGQYLVKLSTQKSNIANVYITADDNWRALLLSGSSVNQAGNHLNGWVIEGRNPADPSVGALVRVTGGNWTLRDSVLNYAMSSPSTYTDTTDRGYLHQTGGAMVLDGIGVDRATGVAESVPVALISGGELVAENFSRATRGGSWTGRPIVQQTSSGLVAKSDYSVTVTTAA